MKTQIQDFDVAFCYRNTLLSKAIRIGESLEDYEKAKFSHTSHFRWIGEELYVFDAQKYGFNPKKYEDWVDKYGYEFIVMRDPELDEIEHGQRLKREANITGKEYDAFSLFVRKPTNIIRRWLNKFRKEQKPVWKSEDELALVFCSEATAYVIGLDYIDLNPQQLFKQLTLEGWKHLKD